MFRRPYLMQMDGWGRHKPQSRLRKVVLEALFYREISVFLCGFFRFFFFLMAESDFCTQMLGSYFSESFSYLRSLMVLRTMIIHRIFFN